MQRDHDDDDDDEEEEDEEGEGNEMNEWMIRMHLHGQWVDGIKWHARQCNDRRNEQTNEGY